MNQETKISIGSFALLAMLSVNAFSADIPTFGAMVTAKDAQSNVAGLGKGEESIKFSTTLPTTQIQLPKAGEATQANIGSAIPDKAPWAGPSFADLEKLRSENALLAEQLKNAELKSKINAQGGSSTFIGSTSLGGRDNASTRNTPNTPKVVMIAGAEGNYRANILLPDGQSITGSIGATVPGVGTISLITPNAVQFGSGKSRRSLPLITSGANADYLITP